MMGKYTELNLVEAVWVKGGAMAATLIVTVARAAFRARTAAFV